MFGMDSQDFDEQMERNRKMQEHFQEKVNFMHQRMNRFRGFGVKYWILGILQGEKSGMTGAMIMAKMEERTHGHWRPSPGHIYPLLEEMSKGSLIKVTAKDGKKYYKITAEGGKVFDNSWFPWKDVTEGREGTDSINEALGKMESYAEFLSDSSAEISKKKEYSERLRTLAKRLAEISGK